MFVYSFFFSADVIAHIYSGKHIHTSGKVKIQIPLSSVLTDNEQD